jgi:hypothetical protein
MVLFDGLFAHRDFLGSPPEHRCKSIRQPCSLTLVVYIIDDGVGKGRVPS